MTCTENARTPFPLLLAAHYGVRSCVSTDAQLRLVQFPSGSRGSYYLGQGPFDYPVADATDSRLLT